MRDNEAPWNALSSRSRKDFQVYSNFRQKHKQRLVKTTIGDSEFQRLFKTPIIDDIEEGEFPKLGFSKKLAIPQF